WSAAACGDDGGSSPSPSASPAGPTPNAERTDEALAAQLSHLAPALLMQADVPPEYHLAVSQPVTRGQVAAANVGIPRLAGFVQDSDLNGAWATFYLRDDPQTGLTSLIYEFESPASAQAFVDAIASLTGVDYPEATSVERVPSDKIEDKAQMMLYKLTASRTYDYTWAQGRFAGQIVLRYSTDIDSPEDRSLMLALARKQADLMRAMGQ
ncbi:MAG TPA: hypothetical protein VFH62_00595, partial [Dehalococcoidia bacterium]|nr:hypothetical protein [Dehalococcoidia bacterium]